MNIHSLTFDIHFCFAIDLSLKKNPNEIFVEILFNLKKIAIQNWNQSYTYILLIFTLSIQIMALQLAQLYKIYTSQRIFTSDMF